jgi:F-type H+-transporting ATPase subunit b
VAVADEGHHAPGHEAEAQPDILEFQPSLAIWTVVVFLGLLFVLGKFAWKPLLNALHQREEHLEHVLLETERARNESERLLAENRRHLAEAEQRARALLEEARAQARASAEDIIQKARAEAEAEQKRAKHEIETARDQALSEIWSKTADLAVSVAGRVLSKSLDDDDRRRLVESAMDELPALANGQGSHA